jgi:hypothetical protein
MKKWNAHLKQSLLKYGLQEQYFTIEEYCFIMNGNNIKDYEEEVMPIEKFTSFKLSKLEEELDEELLLNLAGSII